MPWDGSYGFLFTRDCVVRNAPACSGLYALFTSDAWVYIGESDDMQRSLLEHLSECGPEWTARYPGLAFGFWGMPAYERAACLQALILEIHPDCSPAQV
jgi:hypothetical protein